MHRAIELKQWQDAQRPGAADIAKGLHRETGEQVSGSLLSLVMPVLEQCNSQCGEQGQGNDDADAYVRHVVKLTCL